MRRSLGQIKLFRLNYYSPIFAIETEERGCSRNFTVTGGFL